MKKVDFNKLQAGDLVEVPRTQFAPISSYSDVVDAIHVVRKYRKRFITAFLVQLPKWLHGVQK